MNDSQLTLKLDRARWFAMSNSPFYGSLMMALADKLGNPRGKTACTDGKCIKWDKDFLAKLTDEETRFVLLHETLHCAHGHLWRFPVGKVDHSTANQACDYAINGILASSKLAIAMPKGGLLDSQFDGQSEEEIYSALARKPQDDKQDDGDKPQDDGDGQGESAKQDEDKDGDGDGQGQDGQGNDPCGDFTEPAQDDGGQDDGQDGQDGQGQEQAPSLKEVWERRVIQAAMADRASKAGNCPADMSRVLDRLAACPIDWRQETAEFIKNSASSRNDWTRSPRRHAWQRVIYPSRKANEVGWIIGVRDTSGSIDDKLAAEFSAILASACAELGCGLILLDCDTDIQAEYRIEPGGDVPLTAQGGGGTDFAAPFKRAAELTEQGETIAGLVYLTDLEGSGWPVQSELPTLCLCTNSNQAPSGRTVQILT